MKLAEGPTIAENYKKEEPDIWMVKQWIIHQVIDSKAMVKGPIMIPSPDPFLAYLEWKMSKPFLQRLFLP